MKIYSLLFLLLFTIIPLSAGRFWSSTKKVAPSDSIRTPRIIVPYGTADDKRDVGRLTPHMPPTTTAAQPPQPPVRARKLGWASTTDSETSSTDVMPERSSHPEPRSALPSSYKITPRPAPPPNLASKKCCAIAQA